MKHHRTYFTLRPQPEFYNIQKLNLSSKTDISKTAWINARKRNQNGKVEEMVVLVKTFDHYHHNFQLFQLAFKIVKEFETEI